MKTARRRLSSWAVGASVLAHLGILTAVLMQHPTLTIPDEPAGPPEAIIPVLILPRTPPAAIGGGVRPAPIHLHQRSLRNLRPESPVPPLPLPSPPPAEPPVQPRPSPIQTREAASAAPLAADAIRATLRTALGCAAPTLSRDEQSRCQERLGRGAHDEPYLAQPVSKAKRAALDEVGSAKLAARAMLEAPLARPGGPPRTADYSGNPEMSGAGQDILGPVNLPPSKRAAQKLGPLPP